MYVHQKGFLVETMPRHICVSFQPKNRAFEELYDSFLSVSIANFSHILSQYNVHQIVEVMNALIDILDGKIAIYNVDRTSAIGEQFMVVAGECMFCKIMIYTS